MFHVQPLGNHTARGIIIMQSRMVDKIKPGDILASDYLISSKVQCDQGEHDCAMILCPSRYNVTLPRSPTPLRLPTLRQLVLE